MKVADLINKKNAVQNAWDALVDELDFFEDITISSAIFDIFIDYIFYPFLPNVPFQFPETAKNLLVF